MRRGSRQNVNRLLNATPEASATEPEPYTFEVTVDNKGMHARLVSTAIDHCVEPAGMTAAIVNNHLLGMFVMLHDRWPQPDGVPAATTDKACPKIGNRYRLKTPSTEIRKMLDAEKRRSGRTRADIIATLVSHGLNDRARMPHTTATVH